MADPHFANEALALQILAVAKVEPAGQAAVTIARMLDQQVAEARSNALRTLASAVKRVLDTHDVEWLVASIGKALLAEAQGGRQ